jgi:methylglutaconyl-CoA hydratase
MSETGEGTYRHIQVEQAGAVLRVTLNRPEVRNAFNPRMIAELTAVFSGLTVGGEIRVVVLAGAGAAFCAGADLTWMRAMAGYSHDENVDDALRLVVMLEAVDSSPLPVVGRVQGAALGGGAGLAACCDIVVATDGTQFGFTEARLGLAPATIAPFVLRKIGPGHARALFVTGERFDATRAERIGLVHRVVDPETLDPAVAEAVANILSCGPAAIQACKQIVAGLPWMSLDEARVYTAETIAALRAAPEGQEGMRAFLEKRRPCFAES